MASSIFGNPTLGGTNTWTGGNTFTSTVTVAASQGIVIGDGTPSPTTNNLYNVGGALYFNGSAISAGTSYWSRTGTVLSPATAGDSFGFTILAGTDATYDIGLNAATSRFRDLFLSRNATIGGTLSVSGAGPHAIGGAANAATALSLPSAFTSTGSTAYGIYGAQTLTAQSGSGGNVFGLFLLPSFNGGGGAAGVYATAYLAAPSIANLASLSVGATLVVAGAPSVGSAQYALWSIGGTNRFGGAVQMDSTLQTASAVTYDFGAVTTAAAVLDATKYVNVTIGGVAYKLAMIQ